VYKNPAAQALFPLVDFMDEDLSTTDNLVPLIELSEGRSGICEIFVP